MTYPPGGGGQWQPNDPYQQQGGPGSGGFPAQPQPGFPQTGPQPAQGGFPQAGFPQGGFPQTGPQQAQPGYQFPQQPYGGGQYGYPVPPEAPKKRKGLIIGVVVAVLAVAAGAGVTVWALNRGSAQAGAESPTAAATNLVNAIGKGDVLGLLTGLAPAERDLMTTLNSETTKELKRLEVYKADVDPNQINGFELKTENLKFDESGAEKVNDHLTITKLVGGKVTISSDASKLPLTEEFIDLAFPRGMTDAPQTQTYDVADLVKENKGEPIRIATVKVDDEWYPSLFYTIADYGLASEKLEWPKKSIAARGASSPGDAVRELAQASVNADLSRVIELLPPDEMAVLHDVGPVLVEAAGKQKPADVKILKLETETQDVEDATKVLLKELEVEADGQTVKVTKDGECYAAEVQGEREQICADDLAAKIGGRSMAADAKQALTNLVKGMIANTGVVTTEVDGKWYVSPIRSVTDLQITALKSLQPEDVKALFKLAK
ncbi:proline-rich domain-containing protein [Actinokineospora cianjurensis]|uniref:Flagellar basal body-associated protein FliL n=1 Tax=Actinokineospora cianjurensis TaxID=585224 RepID=A0A421B530_9PSEU|nr:flagellar basal body protein FliL [Actinokineospora cianjurensis]RLK59403.1 hypothetical protein CLV68_3890 [Actinokineospora cianjurensis]